MDRTEGYGKALDMLIDHFDDNEQTEDSLWDPEFCSSSQNRLTHFSSQLELGNNVLLRLLYKSDFPFVKSHSINQISLSRYFLILHFLPRISLSRYSPEVLTFDFTPGYSLLVKTKFRFPLLVTF